MSVNINVYVLKTQEGQYRVFGSPTVVNLNWSFIHFREEKYVPTRLVECFGKCRSTYDVNTAIQIVENIFKHFHINEYSVQVLVVHRTWNRIKHDAINYAKQELDKIVIQNVNGLYNKDISVLKYIIKSLNNWQEKYNRQNKDNTDKSNETSN